MTFLIVLLQTTPNLTFTLLDIALLSTVYI